VSSLYRDTEGRGVWVGLTDGLVSCVDWRVEEVASELRLSGTVSGRWDEAFQAQSACVCVAGVGIAGDGCVALWDTRHDGAPVSTHSLGLPPSMQQKPPPQIVAGGVMVLVSMGDTVSVYSTDNMMRIVQLDGHKQKEKTVSVTSLAIHPTVERLVFSGDNQQGLHAWLFNPYIQNQCQP
jgi:hypothetical protein